MTGKEIKQMRRHLKWTQSDLAYILGVHPITVSRWERSRVTPAIWRLSLLVIFEKVAKDFPEAGPQAKAQRVLQGLGAALYTMLSYYYDGIEQK